MLKCFCLHVFCFQKLHAVAINGRSWKHKDWGEAQKCIIIENIFGYMLILNKIWHQLLLNIVNVLFIHLQETKHHFVEWPRSYNTSAIFCYIFQILFYWAMERLKVRNMRNVYCTQILNFLFSQFCFFRPSFRVGVVWMIEGEGRCFLTGDFWCMRIWPCWTYKTAPTGLAQITGTTRPTPSPLNMEQVSEL